MNGNTNVLKDTGTVFFSILSDVTATLPAAPTVGDSLMIVNNNDNPSKLYRVFINAGGSNEIHEQDTASIPQATLEQGQTALLVCSEAGATKKWHMQRWVSALDVAAGSTKTRVVQTEIQSITNVTAGEFDFNNIPAGFDRLFIKGMVRGDEVTNIITLYGFINEDLTTTNYHNQNAGGLDGTSTTTESALPRVGFCPGGSAVSADDYGYVYIEIEDPNGSKTKEMLGRYSSQLTADYMLTGFTGCHSAVTAAITRLRIRCSTHPTDGLVGTLTLYGEQAAPIASACSP